MTEEIQQSVENIPEGMALTLPPEARNLTTSMIAIRSEMQAINSIFERVALDKSIDIARLREVKAMCDDMKKEIAKRSFFTALSAAQGDFVSARKNRNITIHKKDYKPGDAPIQVTPYADWSAIYEGIKAPLSKYGFTLNFSVDTTEKVIVTAILSHTDGYEMRNTVSLQHDSTGSKNSVQAIGSSIQYGKRYSASALLNLTTADDPVDDDGVAAGLKKEAVALISDEQLEALGEKMKAANVPASAICTNFKIDTLSDLPAAEFDSVTKRLNATIKRKQDEQAEAAKKQAEEAKRPAL